MTFKEEMRKNLLPLIDDEDDRETVEELIDCTDENSPRLDHSAARNVVEYIERLLTGR